MGCRRISGRVVTGVRVGVVVAEEGGPVDGDRVGGRGIMILLRLILGSLTSSNKDGSLGFGVDWGRVQRRGIGLVTGGIGGRSMRTGGALGEMPGGVGDGEVGVMMLDRRPVVRRRAVRDIRVLDLGLRGGGSRLGVRAKSAPKVIYAAEGRQGPNNGQSHLVNQQKIMVKNRARQGVTRLVAEGCCQNKCSLGTRYTPTPLQGPKHPSSLVASSSLPLTYATFAKSPRYHACSSSPICTSYHNVAYTHKGLIKLHLEKEFPNRNPRLRLQGLACSPATSNTQFLLKE